MKRLFYIDFPQESFEGQMHRYRCAYCKVETTTINGKLEGHLPSCQYRMELEKIGHEAQGACATTTLTNADDFD